MVRTFVKEATARRKQERLLLSAFLLLGVIITPSSAKEDCFNDECKRTGVNCPDNAWFGWCECPDCTEAAPCQLLECSCGGNTLQPACPHRHPWDNPPGRCQGWTVDRCQCPKYCSKRNPSCKNRSARCSNSKKGCRRRGKDWKNCSGVNHNNWYWHCDYLVCQRYPVWPCVYNGTWCCGGCGRSGKTYSGCPSAVNARGSGIRSGCERKKRRPYAHCNSGPCSCQVVTDTSKCQCGPGCNYCYGNKDDCAQRCSHHKGVICTDNHPLCKPGGVIGRSWRRDSL
jgi:hypothetical protein